MDWQGQFVKPALIRDLILPDILTTHEPLTRLAAFIGVFAVMALWEVMAPRRRQAIGRLRRWPGNLGVVAIDTLLVRLLFPTAAVGVALLAEARGWGLLPALNAPVWFDVIVAVVVLDLAISSTCCSMPCRCYGACTACITPTLRST